MTRKRKCPDTTSNRPTKLHRPANHERVCGKTEAVGAFPNIHHAVLSSFYPRVCTLRAYFLANLPPTSRVRRRKLTSIGKDVDSSILDTCFVGVLKEASLPVKKSRKVDFVTFTQSQHRATGAYSGPTRQ